VLVALDRAGPDRGAAGEHSEDNHPCGDEHLCHHGILLSAWEPYQRHFDFGLVASAGAIRNILRRIFSVNFVNTEGFLDNS